MSADAGFVTDRLVARSWSIADAAAFYDIYRRWEVARWLGAAPRALETLDEAEARVTRWAELNKTGELEVGWHFHPEAWGRGYATESARVAVRWGFDHGLDEVTAVVRPGNAASLAVCGRLGMQSLGRTSRYYDSELELFRLRRAEVPDGSLDAG